MIRLRILLQLRAILILIFIRLERHAIVVLLIILKNHAILVIFLEHEVILVVVLEDHTIVVIVQRHGARKHRPSTSSESCACSLVGSGVCFIQSRQFNRTCPCCVLRDLARAHCAHIGPHERGSRSSKRRHCTRQRKVRQPPPTTESKQEETTHIDQLQVVVAKTSLELSSRAMEEKRDDSAQPRVLAVAPSPSLLPIFSDEHKHDEHDQADDNDSHEKLSFSVMPSAPAEGLLQLLFACHVCDLETPRPLLPTERPTP